MIFPRSVGVLVALGLFCGLLTGCGGSDDAAVPPAIQQAAAQLDTVVPQLMARIGVPGVAVAVIYRGQTVYARGFGVRKLGEAAQMDADTVFQLASVSKSISATVMAVQMTGSALNGPNDWNTPIQRLMPGFALGYTDPALNVRLTLGQLFAHRSGLHDHAGDRLEDLGYNRPEILQRLRGALLEDFGGYLCTHFGLAAAAEAMARAQDTDWATLSERSVFQPLGMAHSLSHSGGFYLGAGTTFALWPEAGLGITVLTNAQPRGLAEAIALLFGEQALGDVPAGQPSRDWRAFMQPQMHDLYKPEGEHAGQTPPAQPAPPLASYVGRYTNAYYGDAQLSLGAGGRTLELTIGPIPLRYTLRHWSGEEFVFELMGENASRGSLSAVRFGPGRMQIEYFGRDLTRGEFRRS